MVRVFEPQDYEKIAVWWDAHDLPQLPYEDLPNYGLIEPGIGAGFLIMTDARLGILEFYITNPESDVKERSKALNAITKGLIEYGIKVGLKHFKADTQLDAIAERCQKHKFKYIGDFRAYFLSLKEH